MAAPTKATLNQTGHTVLESLSITNYTSDTPTAKAFSPPSWARYATFYLNITSMGGTSPLIDFKLEAVDPSDFDTSAVSLLGSWDGITQKTAGTNTVTLVQVGPDLTADDTGSATASDAYAVQAVLPTWILYTITLDSGTEDEDYVVTLSVEFRK